MSTKADEHQGDMGYCTPCSAIPLLPESANRQRATTQPPQRLDATHGGELFPVDENKCACEGWHLAAEIFDSAGQAGAAAVRWCSVIHTKRPGGSHYQKAKILSAMARTTHRIMVTR